ncbi:MAG: hypothetical protein BTN85_0821 [Candidatus Methanohalarchaeum thermophilum]|uniref:Uncharacterized protein n=1 Tax=Methanohalarchaeum thermophilum TaxID=1903181 RepID=A0A1Q6DVJ3_METT1|nr:MAG: hypothetical protein BTN85_0821 [Candidatus Methanohalarchaeum thermophilum]
MNEFLGIGEAELGTRPQKALALCTNSGFSAKKVLAEQRTNGNNTELMEVQLE